MGIFGDIAGGIGGVLEDVIQTGIPILAGGLAERIAGGSGGPPIIIGGAPAPQLPASFPTPFTSAGAGGIPTIPASFLPQAAAGAGAILRGLGTAGGISELMEFFGGGNGEISAGGFYRTAQTTRPVPRINMQNPVHPEKIDTWLYAGRPVLYSGDLRACRRVNRLARRARGRRGGR